MPRPHRLRDDSQTCAARLGPLAQGDHDGMRGISSPPEDGRDRPLSGAHAGQKRIDETLRALDDLVTEGKVRYIGCANYAGYSLVESLWAADRLQTHRYESVPLQWSLVQRSAERELIPAAAAFGLGVLIWSPLSRGFLSGKYQRGRAAPAGSRLDVVQHDFQAFDTEKNWNLLDVVGRIAKQHETTHSAVSLAWLLARPQTSSILVGARTEAQLEDNLGALSVKLTSEDLKELDDASRPDWDYPWDVIRDSESNEAKLLT